MSAAPSPADPWESRYAALLDEIRREIPGFEVILKPDSRFMRAIHHVLRVVTFGAQSSFLGSYNTTIGAKVYVVPHWERLSAGERYVTMRHELMHLRQFRRYGVVGMALLYVFLPLPAGLAWFRAHFEKEGYAETIRAAAEVYGLDHVRAADHREYVISQFTSGAYGWMWPFRRSLDRWYDAVLASLPGATDAGVGARSTP